MKKKLFSYKTFVLVIGFAVLFYLAITIYFDSRKILSLLYEIPLARHVLIISALILTIFVKYLRWEYFLSSLGIDAPKTKSFLVFMAGTSMAITPGKVGDFLKSFFMKSLCGTKHRDIILIVLLERITDVLALSFIVILSGYFLSTSYYTAILGIFFILFTIIVLRTKKIYDFLLFKLIKHLNINKINISIAEIHSRMRRITSPKLLFIGTFIDAIGWTIESMILFLIATALGANISITYAVFSYTLMILIGALSMLPGGIGASEVSLIGLLTIAGIPASDATAMTILTRIATLWFATFLGVLTLFYLSKNLKKN